MREKDLKRILQQPYSFDNWKELLPMFFKKVQYFSQAQTLFDEHEKVVQGKQIGRITLDDDKSLAIFDVEVTNNVVIARNRKELRDIAIKHIDQDITHGAIVFFHNPTQKDYRFSFIAKWSALDMETGEFKKGETKPKRYTYLLGSNEACTTAAKRLLTLIPKKEAGKATIKELQQVFSVEALNREFFKSYRIHYEKFWKYLAESKWRDQLIDTEKEEIEKQEKAIRDFVKKLLGRIVFLHFLQKKGWMGCSSQSNEWLDGEKRFMQLLFEEFNQKDRFHSQCLTKLFFETLNTKRPNGKFHIDGLVGKLNGSHVPYLNGGLFEPEKNKATLKVDFPIQYFEELLEFFEQYNFTIDENSPDDHEVGIDPEMLGHIFENLLEENREKGAFYTPKEIVQYMCQESLIQYLYNHFGKRQDIDEFIRQHSVSPFLAERDNATKANQLLDNIKVCDPAIGSGAFPIGMMQEIYDAKRFIYPYLKTNQPFNPAATKKNIIQNSIYGVDIEKGAVDIAQLRFWLALVVEEVNPHPLPNLDYKIMQGNSLLEQYEGIDLSKTALMEAPTAKNITLFEEPETEYGFSEEKRESIKQLVKDYFKEEEKEEKARIHKAIDRIVLDHIDKSLEGFENQLLIEIATFKKRYNSKTEQLSDSQKTQYDKKSKELKEIAKRQQQLENKGKARQNLLKFEETDERPYFLWHLYFMNVFEQGGFDVMIGNPPYIQIQKMDDANLYEEVGFDTFSRRGDIYCLFYEKGFDLLNDDGTLTYITSNKWMRGGYGKSLRKFFSETNTLKILDLGPGIFHSATVDTNIYVGKNNGFENNVKGIAVGNRFELAQLDNDDLLPLDDVGEDAWVVLSPADLKIRNFLVEKGLALRDWKVKINFGIKTGFNEAFIIDEIKKDELFSEHSSSKDIVMPLLQGRDIVKFVTEWQNRWIILASYGSNEFLEEKYPAVFYHLFSYKSKLEKRGQCTNKGGQGQHHWLELDNNPSVNYLNQFKEEKIIWKRVGSIMRFAYSDEEIYCLDSTCIATGEKIKYLTAVLNSKTGLYQLFKTSPQTGTGDQIISVQALEPMLVPYPDDNTESTFNKLVDYILFIRKEKEPVFESKSNEDLSFRFEEIIDMMVYEIYFTEEMKAKELDVLQFINENTFPNISEMSPEEKKATIQKVYYELQQKDNPIRNRILVSESRSEIIRRINEVTGS
ncbi:hypothetical protein DZC72_13230 [Maribacter algicola]|uniref:site-specific DNA-methyltransferase (adenine-specific) n=1 Tax=Maribacter algicola TaxID=2498892 RepID=A0A3R8PXJ0_9FLAO|nr:Eco57I restriction-modification methylase domain-containing protein [Maribacter algicola]RRQ48644.1 hypothetical protein DZC72_13230 [Maribacter algicola]